MKKIFLLASSFLIAGCFDIKGATVAFIYPDEGVASVRTITNGCPVKVSEKSTMQLKELSGWVCISPKDAAKFRREYESQCK